MLRAVTHIPSPSLNQCELTYLSPQSIDFDKARRQHKSYCDILRRCGATVITLDKNISLPDSVFVEDTALVLDEIAIMTSMGVASRRDEIKTIEAELAQFKPVTHITLPATLEGGDILRIGKSLYVGRSSRTNIQGLRALQEIVEPYGYQVFEVNVFGCLHLKTGCTALDDHTILINPAWIDPKPFEEFNKVIVPDEESFAANILRIGTTICIHSGFVKTRELVGQFDYRLEVTDISEFLKAEAGLTCMSLIFNT